jgi:hypothetical protein
MGTGIEKRQVIFVTKIHNSQHHVYLIIDGADSYLVNYDIGRLENICPCCLTRQNSLDIMNVVINNTGSGLLKGKIVWVSPSYRCTYGDNLEEFNPILQQDYFIGGNADKISLELISLIREEDFKHQD